MAFYRDLNQTSFANRPYVTDIEAVIQSVRNLVSTRKGERPFRPDYGINIVDYLFELMDDSASLQLLGDVFSAVQTYEPRVTIDRQRSTVTPDPDTYTFEVELFFVVEGFENEGIFNVTETVRQ
jgi:phage baseplate assembly protein W